MLLHQLTPAISMAHSPTVASYTLICKVCGLSWLWTVPDARVGSSGEAAFMTGLERNSDIVFAASYAPLLMVS